MSQRRTLSIADGEALRLEAGLALLVDYTATGRVTVLAVFAEGDILTACPPYVYEEAEPVKIAPVSLNDGTRIELLENQLAEARRMHVFPTLPGSEALPALLEYLATKLNRLTPYGLELPFTQTELGEMVGLTRSSVNALMTDLAVQKKIERYAGGKQCTYWLDRGTRRAALQAEIELLQKQLEQV